MMAKKKIDVDFFAEKSKNHKKWFYHRNVGMLIVKVKNGTPEDHFWSCFSL